MKSVKLAPMPNLDYRLRFANRYSMIHFLNAYYKSCIAIGHIKVANRIQKLINNYLTLTIFDV